MKKTFLGLMLSMVTMPVSGLDQIRLAEYKAWDYPVLERNPALNLYFENVQTELKAKLPAYISWESMVFGVDTGLYVPMKFNFGWKNLGGGPIDLTVSAGGDPINLAGAGQSHLYGQTTFAVESQLFLKGEMGIGSWLNVSAAWKRGTVIENTWFGPALTDRVIKSEATRFRWFFKGRVAIGAVLANLGVPKLLDWVQVEVPTTGDYLAGYNSALQLDLWLARAVVSYGADSLFNQSFGAVAVTDRWDFLQFQTKWGKSFDLSKNYLITASPFRPLLTLIGVGLPFDYYYLGFGWQRVENFDEPYATGPTYQGPVANLNLLVDGEKLALRMVTIFPLDPKISPETLLKIAYLGAEFVIKI